MKKTETVAVESSSLCYLVSRMDMNNDSPIELVILSGPGRKSTISREPVATGWLGTTNGIYEYAHGVFEDVDAAAHFLETEWADSIFVDDGRNKSRLFRTDSDGTKVYQLMTYRVARTVDGAIASYDRDDKASILSTFNSLPASNLMLFSADNDDDRFVNIPDALRKMFIDVAQHWPLIPNEESDSESWFLDPTAARSEVDDLFWDVRILENDIKDFLQRVQGDTIQVIKEAFNGRDWYIFLRKPRV